LVRVPLELVVHEGLQGGTQHPFLLHKKHCFCLPSSVNIFLHFCVLFLLVSKNGLSNFSQPFCSCGIYASLVYQTIDRIILGRMTNPGTRCYVYIHLWCNTMIVSIGRNMLFHHKLPFMKTQRCSSAAATSRVHQKFRIT